MDVGKESLIVFDGDAVSAALLRDFLVKNNFGSAQVIDSIENLQHEVSVCIGDVPKGVSLKDADIFARPVRLGAVLDRLEMLHNRKGQSSESISIADYVLDPVLSILRGENGDVSLTDKERDILLALYERGVGKVVDRETLLAEVWGHRADLETHTVETHIYRLRQKIEKNPANPKILVTDGDGYRLN